MNILLLGSGGRESALAWKMSQSPLCTRLYIAPGNGGTGEYGENVPVNPMDFAGVCRFVTDHDIDMVVAGNEDPLVGGLREALGRECPGVLFVGPGADGARLEGSKDFAKRFMADNHIPTARYHTVTAATLQQGLEYLEGLQPPYVLKADGLAAGKGVLILPTLDEAKESLTRMLDGMFGEAGNTVVIEEFLDGIECSVFVITDGRGGYRLLPVAKDYKRVGDGDTGPNTGGMGSVSPVPFADDAFMQKVREQIIEPTLEGLQKACIDYRGFIFFGLMNVGGEPKVIEYNVRMGDPETESVMPRISSDLVALLAAAAAGDLGDTGLEVDPRSCVSVVAVNRGYPGHYPKGAVMEVCPKDGRIVFQAGTTLSPEGVLQATGGRVATATALADTLPAAIEQAYQGIEKDIKFDTKAFRHDIGQDLVR